MSPRNLLVVASEAGDENALLERVRRQTGAADANIRVVAPASKISALDWLTNDEGEAREQAGRTAESAADAVAGEGTVETEVGDTDPVLAVEDALRSFPADEIIVLGEPGRGEGFLEDERSQAALGRLGLPVTRLRTQEPDAPASEAVRDVASGRSTKTPFLAIGGVAATVWAAAAIVSAVALLLWWLL